MNKPNLEDFNLREEDLSTLKNIKRKRERNEKGYNICNLLIFLLIGITLTYEDIKFLILYILFIGPFYFFIFSFIGDFVKERLLNSLFSEKERSLESNYKKYLESSRIYEYQRLHNEIDNEISKLQTLKSQIKGKRIIDELSTDQKDYIDGVSNFISAYSDKLTPIERETAKELESYRSNLMLRDITHSHTTKPSSRNMRTVSRVRKLSIDWVEKAKKNIETGSIGENLVMEYEREKLTNLGLSSLEDKIEHVSKEQGDGLGYDIKSFDEFGSAIMIEVKTTTNSLNEAFYLTANELHVLNSNINSYYIYQVILDPNNSSATISPIKGTDIAENFNLTATQFVCSRKSA